MRKSVIDINVYNIKAIEKENKGSDLEIPFISSFFFSFLFPLSLFPFFFSVPLFIVLYRHKKR